MDKPEASLKYVHGEIPAVLPYREDRIKIHYGYKNRSSIQIRLEQNGDIYCCIYKEYKTNKLTTVTVPFEVFLEVMEEVLPTMAGRAETNRSHSIS
jgi:hypothetical protein